MSRGRGDVYKRQASRYAKYSDEIDALEAQAIALEAKAEWN